ncbi:hypothetical protein [Acidithrix ferrooxidans]|uniref:ABC-2 family transporter protein n=1 Tax=Acidithrix ferrooxidans TaxID=1280514 RepID=A0A0D8HDL7_9ACTN|nr:hypothetical protein [Acidithrix ferrooxidans]KJF16055.1 hypothetical protein AXFE_30760 [Acidithrix ferrooxidans]
MAQGKRPPKILLWLLGLVVLLVQMGFIASYAGALHSPSPKNIKVDLVAPPAVAKAIVHDFAANNLLSLQVASNVNIATDRLKSDKTSGALIISPSNGELLVASGAGPSVVPVLTTAFGAVVTSLHLKLTVSDVAPLRATNSNGLVEFYLVIGQIVGAYLFAVVLGLFGGMTPNTASKGLYRLLLLLIYSLASGFIGAFLVENLMGYLSGNYLEVALVGSLVVFGVGVFTASLQAAGGIIGTGVIIVLFVVLGNPSAGGPWPNVMLGNPWRTFGPYLPNGAGLDLIRRVVYFGGSGSLKDLIVLSSYLLAGLIIFAAMVVRGKPLVALDTENDDSIESE